MNKEAAKGRLRKIIERYESLSNFEKKGSNEQRTKDHFIRPLFEVLGWDFEEDVWPETRISNKRVDYSFKIGGNTKFFLEAKALSENLDEERWAEQAIDYSWHKSVPWVVLSDFEAIKIFNTEWDEPDIQSCQFIEIPHSEYLTDDRLWWLSKEAFEKGILDKEADRSGRRPKRVIDKQLADDLVRWREILYKNLKAYNPNISGVKILEYVQRILDRLIFIRTLEDRRIEDFILQPLIREWEDNKKKPNDLLVGLNKVFRKIDKVYNSGLFEENAYDHLGDKIDADDNAFVDVIEELYKTKDKGIRYNFSDIPADIFGSIYEQYLGYIQQEDEKEKKNSKRKSHGIYYTPRYIVDYIVQNTVGEVLKDKKPEDIRDIKILDPACGSGSFLISAYQLLIDRVRKQGKDRLGGKKTLSKIEKEFNKRRDEEVSPQNKMRILRDSIFGVDLDGEAVEIARLNLLMKMVGRPAKLPNIDYNIQEGNSLISGTEKELEEYFGDAWKEKRHFNWHEKFKEIFKEGGFDVVIGNPPYIDSEEIIRQDEDFRLYCSDMYESAKGNWDIFCVFIERGLDLLKDGGYFGMIIPNKLLSADYADSIRKIIQKYSVASISDYSKIKVFGASVYPVVIVIQKTKPKTNSVITVNFYKEETGLILLEDTKKIRQASLMEHAKSWSFIFNFSEKINFVDRIIKNSQPLHQYCAVHGAATVSEAYEIKDSIKNLDKSDKKYFKFINTGTIDRYVSLWGRQKTRYIKSQYLEPIILADELKRILPRRYKDSLKSKIIMAGMTKDLECFLDEKGDYYAGKSTTVIESQRIDLKFIVGLLNSRLMAFIYSNIFKSLSLQGGYLRVGTPQVKDLPIIIPPENQIRKVVKLVNVIIECSKSLQELDKFLDKEKYDKLESKIKQTDRQIDKEVYGLYELNREEVKVVEDKKDSSIL